MLKVSKLSKDYASPAGTVHAINDISMDVPDGIFATIVGRSGSGKSTLLALLGALDKPSAGAIEVGDQDITTLNDRQLINYRRRQIGFVFQAYNLIPNLSALENVMLPLELDGKSKPQQRERATKLLEQVGLSDDKHGRKPSRLSGGEQQRVAIARALANRPKLILADEPTGNLDSATGDVIVKLLHDLAVSEHTTIIAVTHDLALAKKTQLTFRLQDGRLVNK